MGFLRGRRGKEPANEAVRETLFGDLPLDRWPPEGTPTDAFPWSEFAAARAHVAALKTGKAKECWRAVIARPGLESRHYLQAWHFLRERGEQPPESIGKQVLGVVVEMAMPEGLDLLAVYADGSARYYNYAGGGVAVDQAEGTLAELIDTLLAASAEVVAQTGPWEEPRRGPPPRGHARISFLTPSGLHFGEGPSDVLAEDPLSSLVVGGASAVMVELVETGGSA